LGGGLAIGERDAQRRDGGGGEELSEFHGERQRFWVRLRGRWGRGWRLPCHG
jgi:hypothetical protein